MQLSPFVFVFFTLWSQGNEPVLSELATGDQTTRPITPFAGKPLQGRISFEVAEEAFAKELKNSSYKNSSSNVSRGLWSCGQTATVAAWDSVQSYGDLFDCTLHPAECWDRAQKAIENLKSFFKNIEWEIKAVAETLQKMSNEDRIQIGCSLLGGVAPDTLVAVLLGGTNLPKVTLAIIEMRVKISALVRIKSIIKAPFEVLVRISKEGRSRLRNLIDLGYERYVISTLKDCVKKKEELEMKALAHRDRKADGKKAEICDLPQIEKEWTLKLESREAAFTAARKDLPISVSQGAEKVIRTHLRDTGTNKQLFDSSCKPIFTREYFYRGQDKRLYRIQEHTYGHQYANKYDGPHFNVRVCNEEFTLEMIDAASSGASKSQISWSDFCSQKPANVREHYFIGRGDGPPVPPVTLKTHLQCGS